MGAGIYLRGKSWYIDMYVDGQRYIERLGPVSRTFAKEEAGRRRAAIIEERLRPKAKDPPFEKLINKYLAEVSVNKAPKSHARDKTSGSHLKSFFSGKRASQITRMDVERYKRDRRGEVSGASVNRELSMLSHIFNVARLPNPAKGVKRFEEFGRERFLDEEEEERMFEAIEKGYPELEPLFRVLLNAGYRLGEVLELQNCPEMVNFKEGYIRIPRMIRKGKKRDVVTPLNDALTQALGKAIKLNRAGKGERIFPYSIYAIDKQWRKIRKEAGLEESVRVHDLRHTFGSRAGAQAHDDPYAVQELMGHQDFRTTQKYIHVSMDRKRAIMERLNQSPDDFPTLKVVNRR